MSPTWKEIPPPDYNSLDRVASPLASRRRSCAALFPEWTPSWRSPGIGAISMRGSFLGLSVIRYRPSLFRSCPLTRTSRSISPRCSTLFISEGATSDRSIIRRRSSFRWTLRVAPRPKSGRELTAMRNLGKPVGRCFLGRIPLRIIGCAQFIDSYPPAPHEFSLPKRASRRKIECVFVKTARTLVIVRARLSL
jgi:hypothetical protein